MALPAEIAPAVRFDLNARDFLWAAGVPGMTAAAEIAIARLVRAHGARRDLVPYCGTVALGTREQGMPGDGLRPRDFAVTGTAFLRNVGRFRLVRIVAGDAGLQRIMGYGVDLWKARGTAWVIAVTKRAVAPFARRWQFVLNGCFNVRRSRPVADFTCHCLMPRVAVDGHNLVVTHGTGLASGIAHRLLLDGNYGSGAVMTSFPECRG